MTTRPLQVGRIDGASLRRLAHATPLADLLDQAAALRDAGHGVRVTYSRKAFIPLTRLCRDVCTYCTFAHPPRSGEPCFMSADEVLAVAREAERAGCHEALFTLGDKPELRYRRAAEELAEMGYASTVEYVAAMCRLVLAETTLFPHVNAGVMTGAEIAALREVSISQGLMLESTAQSLCEKGGPHYGSPDKAPAVRLAMIEEAGKAAVPFTSGLLIGIGETRDERIDAILALRDLHDRYGHLQELIVQNFRAKLDTRMAHAPEPDMPELLWTIAVTRIAFGPAMNIQAPPNLSGEDFGMLLSAGINDWGGVSPVTPDHVNPESPWPEIERLEAETARHGKQLVARLAAYPGFLDAGKWQAPEVARRVLLATDADGLPRMMKDRNGADQVERWRVGANVPPPVEAAQIQGGLTRATDLAVHAVLAKSRAGVALDEGDLVTLFSARGSDVDAVCAEANARRAERVGDTVRYVVNRNINYTNICFHACGFCAFSKGKTAEHLRGPAYDLDLGEVTRRTAEAWSRGATEVCMQGGIHPHYTGETYLSLLRAAKAGAGDIHIHAFSPLEVRHGAKTLGLSLTDYLQRLKAAGLGSLPGTAAEILDDDVRAILCPDKLNTAEWIETVEAAHRVGLKTTATIMFGHVDQPVHWARHLLVIRGIAARTGGITEFVPLPFVAEEAPLFLKGRARPGPTWREVRLMHAVARLALDPLIPNIQASWVKLGEGGVQAVLQGGVNDLGGTLMNESISRAAGAAHGQEWEPLQMEQVIDAAGRVPAQRTTLYGQPPIDRQQRSRQAAPLSPMVQTAPKSLKFADL